jgi:hypothetical protein
VTRAIRSYWAVFVSLALVAALAGTRAWVYAAAPDSEPYHAAIREAARLTPLNFGQWVGREIAVPKGVVAVLQPNVLMSRQFQGVKSEPQISLLIVQCADARELLGHYPPTCYRSQGWVQQRAKQRDWAIDGLKISGMEYQFISGGAKGVKEVVINNFMILPDGTTCPDMKAVNAAAKNFRRRSFGAAQVQMVSSASMTADERRDAWELVIRAHRGLIEEIRSGGRS